MICQDIEELSGAYVLDAVTPLERKAVEEHVVSCLHCTRLLQELQAVTAFLPMSVPLVEPPPSLRTQVLARIQAEGPHTEQLDFRPQRHVQQVRWRRWTNPLVAVAAVLLFALLSSMTVWNISLQRQLHQLTSSSPISYDIKGTSVMPEATGQMVYIPKQDITVLTINGLPEAGAGKVYQGWLLHCKQPESVGILSMQNGMASESFRGDVKGYSGAAVSLEPGPGASKDVPRGQVVATGSINPSASIGCPAS